MSSEDIHDPYHAPIIPLPDKVEQPQLEEDEELLFTMRAKLFRWAPEADPAQWKERGTGDVKLLQHKQTKRIRLLMRRDKTFKTCANHYLDRKMKLVPNSGSDRAWVWTALADFAEEELKKELFAIRFLNAENANKFKEKFCECQEMLDDIKQGQERFQLYFNKQSVSTDDNSSSESEGENQTEEKGDKNEESTEKGTPQDKGETVVQKLEELCVTDKVKEEDPGSSENKTNPASVEDSPEK